MQLQLSLSLTLLGMSEHGALLKNGFQLALKQRFVEISRNRELALSLLQLKT